MNLIVRPGIKEAIEVFWKFHDQRTPKVVSDVDREFIFRCLLLALGKLNEIRDKQERELTDDAR